MKKKVLSALLLSTCVMLVAGPATYADGEQGPKIDPNGLTADQGPGVDPIGATSDQGPGVDPIGATSDQGPGVDPIGKTGQSSSSVIGVFTDSSANISGSLIGSYISLLPRAAF